MHIDLTLIEDGTYFVHEADDEIIACGGWSRRGSSTPAPDRETTTSD